MSTTSAIEGALAAAREDGAVGGDESIEEGTPAEETEVVEGDSSEEGEGETTEEAEETTEEAAEGEEEAAEGEAEVEEVAEEQTEEEEEGDPDFGPAKDKHGRENRIPHSRVVKMVGKKIAKLTSVVAKSLGLDAATVTTENLGEALSSVGHMRGRLQGFDEIEPIMRQDGDTFIQMLAEANPEQYGKFLAVLEEGYDPSAASKVAEKDIPQPDVEFTLPDGTKGKTYSLKQMDLRDAWKEAQMLAKVEKQLGKRFKPIEDARTAAQRINDNHARISEEIRSLLGEAREDWDGFVENEQEIQKIYHTIPKSVPMARALRQAYNKVVVQKFKSGKAKARQETLAELKAAPKSTSAKGKVVKKVDHIRNEDGEVVTGTEAAVRRSLAAAKSAGLR
jgi:hypothetical protein